MKEILLNVLQQVSTFGFFFSFFKKNVAYFSDLNIIIIAKVMQI